MTTIVAQDEQPISRTYQYRKVMKPMLERKRRARINRCLDELKELLVGALQAEGESVSRLEKADVLELTVRHLHKLRCLQQLNENSASERFKAGFITCTNEVSKYMSSMTAASASPNGTTLPAISVDLNVSSRLLSHLDHCIHQIDQSNINLPANNGPLSNLNLPNVALISPQQHHQHNSPSFSNSSSSSCLSPSSTSTNNNNLNISTTYTPPSSPISSPNNKLYHPYAQMIGLGHHHLLPSHNNHLGDTYKNSPSPAHIQNPFNSTVPNYQNQQQQLPLSLCTKPGQTRLLLEPMDDEPFDLSSNVWRPW